MTARSPRPVDRPDTPFAPLLQIAVALREAGMSASTDRIVDAAHSVGHWQSAEATDCYWPLRIALCRSETDLFVFDAVYRALFPGDVDGEPEGADGLNAWTARTADDNATSSADVDGPAGAIGALESLTTRSFENLTERELAEVVTWIRLLRPAPTRPAMQRSQSRAGAIDATRTARAAMRTVGEPLIVRRRRRTSVPRQVTLIVDVSASMSEYTEVLLHFGYALIAAQPSAEVFAVGTRCMRLTNALTARRIDVALRAAGAVRTDWSGGTNLGVALRDLLRGWGSSRAIRSAVVVLASDGVEFGDHALMAAQIARLATLARALVWADPLHRTPTHRRTDKLVAEAQTLATTVTGCHSLDALRELTRLISDA